MEQVWDNVLLGAWVHKVRKQAKDGILPQWQKDKLDDLLFVWKVEQQNAKWHFHLHEARRFKVRFPQISYYLSLYPNGNDRR